MAKTLITKAKKPEYGNSWHIGSNIRYNTMVLSHFLAHFYHGNLWSAGGYTDPVEWYV